MADLEDCVRAKQIERLPISKGEILLSDLASRYPELENDIQEEHEARQFVSALGTSPPSSFPGTSLPNAPMEAKHTTSRTSTGKKGKRSAVPITHSPLLRPTGSDLIFDMDDDPELGENSPTVRFSRPDERDGAKNPWRDVSGKPLKEQPPTFSPNQRFRVGPESVSAGPGEWSQVKTPGRG